MAKKVALGQYYTSPLVADFIVSLASTGPRGKVMEAGYGEGAFLQALLDAGYKDITGYDIDRQNYSFVQKRFGDQIRAYHQSFLQAPGESVYNLVIGNPPYVRWGNLDQSTKDFLLQDPFWKQYSSGEWDLLYAFIIWSVQMLQKGGELIFIVPYNWFSSTYAASLRQYLLDHGHFTDIIHFNEYKVFKDAAPNTIIFRFQKSPAQGKLVRVVELQSRTMAARDVINGASKCLQKLDKKEETRTSEWHAFYMEQFQNSAPWYLASPKEKKITDEIESKASAKLSDVADVAVGVVSGYDKAYAVDADFRKQLNSEEKKLLRRFVKARNCKRFRVSEPAWFIMANSISDERELARHPHIYAHLLGYKQALLDRYGSHPEQWWHWATVRNIELFQKHMRSEKIFVPCTDRSKQARFSLTKKQYLGSGDVLLLAARAGTDPYYLQAWLSSDVFNQWYQIKGPRTGYRTRYTQSFMGSVPFLDPDHLQRSDLKAIIRNTQEMSRGSDNFEKLDRENNKIFYKVFPTINS